MYTIDYSKDDNMWYWKLDGEFLRLPEGMIYGSTATADMFAID